MKHLTYVALPKINDRKWSCIAIGIASLLLLNASYAEGILDVESYLNQVENNNEEYIATKEMQNNYFVQSQQGSLLFAPRFVSSAQAEMMEDPQFIPYFPIFLKGGKLINEEYKIGFEQETPIGLDWQLNSVASLFEFKANISDLFPNNKFVSEAVSDVFRFLGSTLSSSGTTWNTVQGLTVTQHLWKNGFGEKTRAKANQAKHGALAQSYMESFKLQKARIQAASIYWQLVIARALKKIRVETLYQTEELMNHIEIKKKASLVLESDVYQARSILNTSLLEVQRAEETLSAAALSFNSLRGVSSEIVNEDLHPLTSALIESMAPQSYGDRNDLKAHREMLKNQEAENLIAIHDLLPDLDVTGSIGLQGTSMDFGNSFDRSIHNPALNAGIIVKLSIPLAPTKISAIKRSYKSSSQSAQLSYERQRFEQGQEWKRLKTRLDENLRLLKFLVENEAIQEAKFENIQLEYSRGLSTFFTVTSAQSDVQSAKVAILQTFQTLIEILLNLSLYEPD